MNTRIQPAQRKERQSALRIKKNPYCPYCPYCMSTLNHGTTRPRRTDFVYHGIGTYSQNQVHTADPIYELSSRRTSDRFYENM